jgi:hypothetical protein
LGSVLTQHRFFEDAIGSKDVVSAEALQVAMSRDHDANESSHACLRPRYEPIVSTIFLTFFDQRREGR